jgi:hypothetical protein
MCCFLITHQSVKAGQADTERPNTMCSYHCPLGFRSPNVGALRELFPDGDASKELHVRKPFRCSAPNAESDVA